jgi:hypothetical protein
MLSRSVKPRICANCGKEFLPFQTMQKVCPTVKCARGYVKKLNAVRTKEWRERRRAIEPLSAFRKRAQDAFNKWVRARDEGLPCVSCGEINPPMKPGGQWDAGHFLGRGAYPELAFEELNCWRQCKSCNGGGGKFKHKERTVNQKYEEELRKRIGDEKVDWLKGPHEPKKYTREDYEAIEADYKARAKELKARSGE